MSKEGDSTFQPAKNDLSIKTLITKPENIKFHWIQDTELEVFMKINSPISTMISLACCGYVLGELNTIYELYGKMSSDSFVITDIISVFLIGLAVSGFVFTGIYALKGKTKVDKVLEVIRARKTIEIDPNLLNNS